MEFNGHLKSLEIKLWKTHEHNISRKLTVKDPILSMQMPYIEMKIHIIFGEGKNSFDVIGHLIVKNL